MSLNNSNFDRLLQKYTTAEFFRFLFKPSVIQKILLKDRTVKFKNENNNTLELTLTPIFTSKIENLKKIVFNFNPLSNIFRKGSFANIYLHDNIIFKIIKKNIDIEYYGLIFNYLIYYYYKKYNEQKLEYLCNIIEFGEIRKPLNNKIIHSNLFKYIYSSNNTTNVVLYAIMENCGESLDNIGKNIIEIKNLDDNSSKLFFMIKVFIKCLHAVKIIHDLNYLHLDIKPQNFLFNIINSKTIKIKIIDFGTITKCNTEELDYKGSYTYIPNDWIINKENEVKTLLKKHHDIFELGCLFIEIIFNLFASIVKVNVNSKNIDYSKYYMCCPLIFEKLRSRTEIIELRKNYNIEQHNTDMETIYNLLLKIEINVNNENKKDVIHTIINQLVYKIIYYMVHPNPEQRFQSINSILTILTSIQKNINSYF